MLNLVKFIISLEIMILFAIIIYFLWIFQSENVYAIINGKLALRYARREVDAMKAIATAHKNRSLNEFETALAIYKDGKLQF